MTLTKLQELKLNAIAKELSIRPDTLTANEALDRAIYCEIESKTNKEPEHWIQLSNSFLNYAALREIQS